MTKTNYGTRAVQAFLDRQMSKEAAAAALKFLPHLERGRNARFAEEMIIGPAEAEFLLADNPDNRNISTLKVYQFSKDLRFGRFKNNGETIVVARTGELNDGQHRLLAIYQTKIPATMLVSFGVERDTRDTIDTGAIRTAANILHMQGFQYATQLTSTARMLLAYEQAKGRSLGRLANITSLEQQERVKIDELLREIVVYVAKNKPSFVPTSTIATAFYILARISATDARAYIDSVMKGTGLKESDPAYLVRERLMRAKAVERSGGGGARSKNSLTPLGKMEVLFRGWNNYITGKTGLTNLQVRNILPTLKRPKNSGGQEIVEDETGAIPENIVPYDIEETTRGELEVA